MESRFTVKDLVVVVLLVAILVAIGLMLRQYDRQWDEVQAVKKSLEQQAGEVSGISQRLAALLRQRASAQTGPADAATTQPGEGVNQTQPAATAAAATDDADPFVRLKAVRMQAGYAAGDWLVDAFAGNVRKLTPLLSGDSYADLVEGSVLESLIDRDPETLEYRPLVAESWTIHENLKPYDQYLATRQTEPLTEKEVLEEEDCPGAEQATDRAQYLQRRLKEGRLAKHIAREPQCPSPLTIEFRLRPNVNFSDGQPLTAADVKFTYDLIMDPRIAAPRQRAYFEMIKAVETRGPQVVAFRFKEPYFEAFALAGGMRIMPAHFYRQFSPQEFNKSVGLLMGSGPFRMDDPEGWKPGKLIRLVRNERYWGTAPAFQQLVYREITNDVARVTSFRNGDIDLFACTPEHWASMTKDPAIVGRTRQYEYQSPLGGYRYIAWNQRDPQGKATVFADKRVRQAMTLLLNREQLLRVVMLGKAAPATGPFNPLSKQCNPEVQAWPHDLARARALLAEAGMRFDARRGLLLGPDGRPFRVKLTYPSGSPIYEKMVLHMKDAYAKAGIVLEPDPLEWAVFTDRLEQKNFQAITLGWTAGIETDIYQMFHSSQMLTGGDNFMSYQNKELDRLIDEARRTIDEDRRMPLWRRCHAILHEDQPYTFLFFSKSLRLLDQRIENARLVKLGMNPREEWFVPASRQRWTRG